jgi:hypothetical protein
MGTIAHRRSLATGAFAGGSKSDGVELPVAGRGESDEPCGDSGDYQGDKRFRTAHLASNVS